jgi:hypothetical protein
MLEAKKVSAAEIRAWRKQIENGYANWAQGFLK